MYLLKQDQCYLVLWEICHYFMTFNQEYNSTPRNEQKNRNCKETMNGHNHFYMHADPEPSLTTIHGLCMPNKKCASIKSEGTRVHRERYEFCSDGNNGQNVKHSTLGSTTYTHYSNIWPSPDTPRVTHVHLILQPSVSMTHSTLSEDICYHTHM